MPRLGLSLVLVVLLLSACRRETLIEQKQRLLIESEPPGGTVYVIDEAGRSLKGSAPLTIETPYQVKGSEFDSSCWITPGVGAGVAGLSGLVLASADSPLGTAPAIGVSAGLVLGIGAAALGSVVCLASMGEGPITAPWDLAPMPDRAIEVALAGHAPQRMAVLIPGPDRKLAFRLEPAGPGAVAATSPGPAVPPAAAPGSPGGGSFAAGAPQPTSFALVIGVEKYRDLPPPTGARGDAQRFAELARKTLGVPAKNVILALDDRATKSDLEKHLAWLEKNVPAGGRIYLFFAGHGAPEPTSGTAYLLPYDADPAALPGTALELSGVTARLGKTKAREVVAFLDSCFSGTGGRSVLAPGTRPLVPVQKVAAAPKVSVLAAVTGAQTSGAFSAGGGLFSHYLLEALGSGKADLDGDGQITLREVSSWIGPRVEREASRDSRDQLPSLTSGAGVDPGQAVLAVGVTGG